jgi:hypothetical protein
MNSQQSFATAKLKSPRSKKEFAATAIFTSAPARLQRLLRRSSSRGYSSFSLVSFSTGIDAVGPHRGVFRNIMPGSLDASIFEGGANGGNIC